jgi:hypothetical protein
MLKRLIIKTALIALPVALLVGTLIAHEGDIPRGMPRLDHVFVIMMENHGYSQIVNNPNAPFINKYAKRANTADNYFAIAHPSLTNYLEVVGGSNFNVLSDNNPDWHNPACTPNLASGQTNIDVPALQHPQICPIAGSGTDAPIPVLDPTPNEGGSALKPLINIDGVNGVAASQNIVGKTIGDQLVAAGLSWKSYQESLPPSGADCVNFADGFFTDSSDIPGAIPGEKQTLIKLYAAKHNPFVYFQSVQEGFDPRNSLKNVVGFSGSHGLFADLASGHVPSLAFIAPNQCNDQHGRDNAGPQCDFDPSNNGTQVGLNPASISLGDQTVQSLVELIHGSPAWQEGRSAIVVVWDENDYTATPITNQVLVIVETNHGDGNDSGAHSKQFYTHFSLLKSLESAFGLSCLNHACDAGVHVMSDVFGR